MKDLSGERGEVLEGERILLLQIKTRGGATGSPDDIQQVAYHGGLSG